MLFAEVKVVLGNNMSEAARLSPSGLATNIHGCT